MKKFIVLAAVLMLAIAFTACGDNGTPEATPTPTEAPPVEATPTPEPPVVVVPEEPEIIETGVNAGFVRDGSAGSGLDIIIGSGTDVWPFAASQAYGGRAFEPIPGRTYRITYYVQSDDATGWRVRWMSTGYDYPDYTQADRDVVNDFPVAQGEVATVIPAHFTFGAERGETFELVVEITLDPEEEYNGLIGNITLRGTAGSSEWFAHWMTVSLLEDGPGSDVEELLVQWER
ncbi:MAG: hypothetical protein FWC89_06940 [Defluviitaleaceae bacterium]|nr:hypothetical protein [Defluviitaleaceae bacterium]